MDGCGAAQPSNTNITYKYSNLGFALNEFPQFDFRIETEKEIWEAISSATFFPICEPIRSTIRTDAINEGHYVK